MAFTTNTPEVFLGTHHVFIKEIDSSVFSNPLKLTNLVPVSQTILATILQEGLIYFGTPGNLSTTFALAPLQTDKDLLFKFRPIICGKNEDISINVELRSLLDGQVIIVPFRALIYQSIVFADESGEYIEKIENLGKLKINEEKKVGFKIKTVNPENPALLINDIDFGPDIQARWKDVLPEEWSNILPGFVIGGETGGSFEIHKSLMNPNRCDTFNIHKLTDISTDQRYVVFYRRYDDGSLFVNVFRLNPDGTVVSLIGSGYPMSCLKFMSSKMFSATDGTGHMCTYFVLTIYGLSNKILLVKIDNVTNSLTLCDDKPIPNNPGDIYNYQFVVDPARRYMGFVFWDNINYCMSYYGAFIPYGSEILYLPPSSIIHGNIPSTHHRQFHEMIHLSLNACYMEVTFGKDVSDYLKVAIRKYGFFPSIDPWPIMGEWTDIISKQYKDRIEISDCSGNSYLFAMFAVTSYGQAIMTMIHVTGWADTANVWVGTNNIPNQWIHVEMNYLGGLSFWNPYSQRFLVIGIRSIPMPPYYEAFVKIYSIDFINKSFIFEKEFSFMLTEQFEYLVLMPATNELYPIAFADGLDFRYGKIGSIKISSGGSGIKEREFEIKPLTENLKKIDIIVPIKYDEFL